MDFSKLTDNQKIIVNSCLVASITMFSIFATQPPSFNILYSGLVGGMLSGIIQLQKSTDTKILMII